MDLANVRFFPCFISESDTDIVANVPAIATIIKVAANIGNGFK